MSLKQLAGEIGRNAYYYASLPWRTSKFRELVAREQVPLCALFYHRIADSHPNGWTMSHAQFQRQVDWMQQNVDLVSMEEIQRRKASGKNERVAVNITFDDGYAENCERALPMLIERGIPCTYFVSLDFILTQRPFPHDVEAGVPLQPNTIEQLRDLADAGIEIGAHTRNHPNIGAITDFEALHDEIVNATRELADLIDRPIRYFAYPFGKPENMSQAATDMARESGLEAVCSAYGAYNLPGEDPFHIQRIHGDPEFSRFRNWLTIDPRKLGIGRDFKFRQIEISQPACIG
ncbi:MAG: polysaccharide deacetylase family protein [Planctomycetota bacterium]